MSVPAEAQGMCPIDVIFICISMPSRQSLTQMKSVPKPYFYITMPSRADEYLGEENICCDGSMASR